MILMYHKIHPVRRTEWWVTVDAFDRQMAALAEYDVVYLDDYDPQNPRHAAISFDGVYADLVPFALPILRKWGHPFELFVIGDHIGEDNEFDQHVEPPARFASLTDLDALVEGGGRVQWHTRTHRNLAAMDAAERGRELAVPDELRERFGEPHLRWFAYPHAEHTPELRAEVGERFHGALGGEDGDPDDRWLLPRKVVFEDTPVPGSRVSVIVANYNYGEFLPMAVDSVLRQTQPPDEILVIDDASTDSSAEVLSWWEDDERVRVERNPENLGIVGNFRRGVELTSGDYVAFLGADNMMRSDYVERMRAALDRDPGAALAYPDMAIYGPRAAILAAEVEAEPTAAPDVFVWRVPDPTPDRMAKIEHENFITGSAMYRRADYEAVGGYREAHEQHEPATAEDHDLFRRMIARGRSVVHVPHALIEYNQHSAGQANTVLRYQLEAAHHRQEAAYLRGKLEETRAWLANVEPRLAAALEDAERKQVEVERLGAELDAVYSGGWWRLRGRLSPLVRLARRVLRRG